MNFDGKRCGICQTRLSKITDEVADGVYVDAYKCKKGHISYSEEVMSKVEALNRDKAEERRIVKIGSSLAVPIPSKIVKALGLKPKLSVYINSKGQTITIRPSQM